MKRTLVLLVVLAACKKKPAEKHDAAPAPPPVVDAAVAPTTPDAAVDAAAATIVPDAPPGALEARVDGVGPITAKTHVKALKAAFSGYEVKKVSKKMGDGDLREEYVGISKGKTLLLKVVGDDEVISVDITSNDVWNPWGIQIGATYAEIEKAIGKLQCQDAGEAVDWRADLAECNADKIDNYTFDFSGDGMGKDLVADPAKLAQAKLVAIRWEAPGHGPPIPGTE